jgi:2-oxoglutarate dehydrogenase complex dehydrogenase (E1) component-like enzyme
VSGKHGFTVMNEREKRNIKNMAVVRLERLCPFPVDELREAMSQYKNAKSKLM